MSSQWDTGCAEVILAAVHFSPLSAGMEADGRTQVLPTHKELFVQPVVAVYVDVKTKARKKTRSCPAEPRSLLTQPFTDVGVKAKDRKTTMPVTNI